MSNKAFEEAKKVLSENGELSDTTSGISMYPMLVSGRDIIVIKPPVFPLKKHDVPLYCREGCEKLILHRIVKKPKGSVYIIRGDNTYYYEYVNQDDIVGVLDGFFRKGKYHNCQTDKGYRFYIILMRAFYPVRYMWKSFIPRAIIKTKLCIKKML